MAEALDLVPEDIVPIVTVTVNWSFSQDRCPFGTLSFKNWAHKSYVFDILSMEYSK